MDLEQLHAMCQEPRPHEQQQRSNQQVFEKRAGLVIRSRLLRVVVTTLKSRMWSMTNDPVSCKKIIFGVLPCLSYPHTIPISTLHTTALLTGVFARFIFILYYYTLEQIHSSVLLCNASAHPTMLLYLPPTRAICLPKNQDTCCVN